MTPNNQLWISRRQSSLQNISMVFYETPFTAQYIVNKKSIKVFVKSNCCTVNCSIFDFDNRIDMVTQLNEIEKLHVFDYFYDSKVIVR